MSNQIDHLSLSSVYGFATPDIHYHTVHGITINIAKMLSRATRTLPAGSRPPQRAGKRRRNDQGPTAGNDYQACDLLLSE